jgi:hypothetical protein
MKDTNYLEALMESNPKRQAATIEPEPEPLSSEHAFPSKKINFFLPFFVIS